MPAGIMSTSTAPRLLKVGLRNVFFDEFDRFPTEYDKFLHVETTDKYQEEDVTMGMIDKPISKAEGVGITYYTPTQGYYKQYTWVEYAAGFRVTRVMRDDDQYRIVERMPRNMGVGMNEVVETVAANLINNGFDATNYPLPDGYALFDTDRPLLDSTTQDNKPSTDVDMTPYQIQALLTILEGLKDFTGYKAMYRPNWLFYRYNQRWAVDEMLGSALKAYTSDNTLNVVKGNLSMGGSLKPLPLHFMTDEDAWGIQATRHFMYFFWRHKPEFNGPYLDEDTFDQKYNIYARFDCGATDHQGIVATSGG